MSEQHRKIRVAEREGVYDVICDVCHEQIMEGCSEVDIQKYLSCHNCHMVGECETLSFYKGPAIPYMRIETAAQFAEYCEEVERYSLTLEEAESFMKVAENSSCKYVVENDVLKSSYGKGAVKFDTDLMAILKLYEEEIKDMESWMEFEDEPIPVSFMDCLLRDETGVLREGLSVEEGMMIVMEYQKIFGPILERLTVLCCNTSKEEESYG